MKKMQRQSKQVNKQDVLVPKKPEFASANTLNEERHKGDLYKFKKEFTEYIDSSIQNLAGIRESTEAYFKRVQSMDANKTTTDEIVAEIAEQHEVLRTISEAIKQLNKEFNRSNSKLHSEYTNSETSKKTAETNEIEKATENKISFADLLKQLGSGRNTLPPDLVSQVKTPEKSTELPTLRRDPQPPSDLKIQSETPTPGSGIRYNKTP